MALLGMHDPAKAGPVNVGDEPCRPTSATWRFRGC